MTLLADGLNLFDTCQLFLIPATIFFAALGVAKTEMLKAAISLLATAVSLLWCVAMFSEFDEGKEILDLCVWHLLVLLAHLGGVLSGTYITRSTRAVAVVSQEPFLGFVDSATPRLRPKAQI